MESAARRNALRLCSANVSYPLVQTVARDSESSSYFRERMTSLGHLANGFILKLGGVSLMTHGTPSDSSMLAILVSTNSGEVQSKSR